MKTKSTEPLNYRIGWLATLFASHSGYESFSLVENGIQLAGHESVESRIFYLAMDAGVTIEQGYFWDVLAIHLENGKCCDSGACQKNNQGLYKQR